jgi:hypothetical protein
MQNLSPSSDCATIEMHLKEVSQLFDTLDHSPFHEKDLDGDAEEYIVERFKDLPARNPYALVIYVDAPVEGPREQEVVEGAVRVHFARKAESARLKLKRLMHVGWISLGIGLSVLVTLFLLGHLVLRLMGNTQPASLIRESLLIGGWVAMWKPLEILLYDWWPLVSDKRLYERLAGMSVRLVSSAP